DLKRLKAAVSAEEARFLAERAKYFPSFLVVGGLRYGTAPGREDQDSPFAKDDFNYDSFGGALGVKWDLNFLATNAAVEKQRVGYLKVRSQMRQGVEGIDLLVKEKYQRVKEYQANLETSFESRKAGRALLVVTLTNFKFGIGSGKDVFDALSVYARTAGDYHETVFDYNMAVLELKAAVGTALEGVVQSGDTK
ncbi:MAG: TolC family protein, partial [Rubrivivax sp.]|nr:TolC family protein [Rubrivivax sp.]